MDRIHGTTSSPALRCAGFILIAILVFLSRFLTRGLPYFVDGPRLIDAIRQHTYVVQAPGYWLYARTGGLFPDPAFGLVFINECCSALGAAFLFLVCLDIGVSLAPAFLSALAAASVYFVWFAGDVHSSYATQLLFPVLASWFLIAYRRDGKLWRLLAAAAALAIGTGMRPSDGAFLFPLFAVFLFRFARPRKHLWFAAALFAILCLGWYVPTVRASHMVTQTVSGQMVPVADGSSVLFGAKPVDALANVLRLVLPIVVAFWMLVPAWIAAGRRATAWPLLLWIAPGFLFFLLIHIANPAYLVFAVPALIVMAALAGRRRLVVACLTVCILWNSLFFLAARPIRSRRTLVLPLDYYAIMYTHYAIRHRWMNRIGDNQPIP